MNLTVTCFKHKDVEAGCEHEFSLLPVRLSDDKLSAGQSTLVVGRPGEFSLERKVINMGAVNDLVMMLGAEALRDGLSAKQIAESLKVSRPTANRTIKQAIELGMVKDLGGARYPSYGLDPNYSEPDHN
jgi:hypothetical protein